MNTFSTGKTQSMIVGQQKSELPGFKFSIQYFATFLLLILLSVSAGAQVITTGCLMDDFGTNAVLYTGTNFGGTNPPAGTVDWYKYTTGRNVIIQDAGTVTTLTNLLQGSSVNPLYEVRMNGGLGSYADYISAQKYKLLYDAVFARDYFGGSGAVDTSAFSVGSKNGMDPADWSPTATKVLGKNDLIDVASHMFRAYDQTRVPPLNDFVFVGLINRAEPGGDAYMDFEFFRQNVSVYKPTATTYKFTTGGPDMGHTSFAFAADGTITALGDMIYNISLTNGGSYTNIDTRIWVKYTDFLNFTANPQNLPFRFGVNFDGAVNGAPFGNASIVPKPSSPSELCGYVNTDLQLPDAPPWGTRNSKSNVYGTSYSAYSVAEVGLNLTDLGLDNDLVTNTDRCTFPWLTVIIKTRTSDSFTSALKDYAGPFGWGYTSVGVTTSNKVISCDTPIVSLIAAPARTDATYLWTTTDGHIVGSATNDTIQVEKPGNYIVAMTVNTGCVYTSTPFVVTSDPAKPLFSGSPAFSYTIPCGGNDATLKVTVNGATPPYTYSLYNATTNTLITQATGISNTTYTFTGISAGSYTVVVKGIYACTISTGTVTIPAKTPVVYTPAIANVDCNGNKTGSILLGTVTGKATLSYAWSTGNASKDLMNVGAGTYTVTITDGDGCKTINSYTVTQPLQPLSATISKTDDPGNAGNGSATVTASGGTAPYTYEWRKTPSATIISTSATASNLGYGEYTVKVTDANLCTVTKTIFIYEKERCFDGIDNDGNGLTDCQDPSWSPAKPSISGPLTPCIGLTVTYSIASPPGGLVYNWVIPSNATLLSGQGTSSINLKWNSVTPGQICVQAANEGPVPAPPAVQVICLSPASCISVTPSNTPQPPSSINKN